MSNRMKCFCRLAMVTLRGMHSSSSSLSWARSLHVSPSVYKTPGPGGPGGDKLSLSAVITVNRLGCRRHHYRNESEEKTSLEHFVPQHRVRRVLLQLRVPEVTKFSCKGPQPISRAIHTSEVKGRKTEEEVITEDSKMNQVSQLNQAKNIWRKADAICFDVDSTVIQDEAIDELAKFCGKGDEVEQLTREAMKGGMDFRQALALRLDLIRPSLKQLTNYILSTKHRLSPYVKELVHELHKREKEVYLVSGGFRSIIIPLAQELHIPTANVYANKLKFYHDGEYAGFDENQLTSRTGGKGAVVRNLKEKHGYETVVMVGDGITDWEASPPADLFIGFGGNAYRHEVKSKSKWYVTDFRDLINELRD